ncbi:BppU family phage baseplate upper protein, partial [Staphylococcus sp. EG-SA-26]|uniref:BppU family phage baseplate upper protein n=1 Tax=Staphylococcus sp. EG-SA-26 TaxID=2767498 RepID=UPI001F11F2C6
EKDYEVEAKVTFAFDRKAEKFSEDSEDGRKGAMPGFNVIFNGRLQYVIPNEFLKHSGKVHAQAFFTQNGSNNVVVERQFSFNI